MRMLAAPCALVFRFALRAAPLWAIARAIRLFCRAARAGSIRHHEAGPKLAKKLVELAAKAEAAGDDEAALRAYEEAARYAPFDVTIVSKKRSLALEARSRPRGQRRTPCAR